MLDIQKSHSVYWMSESKWMGGICLSAESWCSKFSHGTEKRCPVSGAVGRSRLNFRAVHGLELPIELVWLSRQPICRTGKGQVFLPLQTSFLCLIVMSCITAGVRGLCRHDNLPAKCQFAVKLGMVGKETQLFSTAFQPSHAFCVRLQMLPGQSIALKDLCWSCPNSSSGLKLQTAGWVRVQVPGYEGKRKNCSVCMTVLQRKKMWEFILITAVVRMRRSYCYMKSWVIIQDTAHPVAQTFLWKVLPSNCHKLIFIWITQTPGN